MTLETYKAGGDILDESVLIADELLSIQEEVNAAAAARQGELLRTVRDDLGYSEADPVSTEELVDVRITSKNAVVTPGAVATVVPLSRKSAHTTITARQEIDDILTRRDDRLMVIAGPCSIHDPESALEYAAWLKDMKDQYAGELTIVMRAYMEKPRTELGWKGFVYDPFLDGTNQLNVGLVGARLVMARITDLGVPIATERLNASTPQYLDGLVAYDAIGARTTTDQKAREYASGTSSPVGFKNTPEGSVLAAAEAVAAANAPHDFLGLDKNGVAMQVSTTGNALAHIILRGDTHGPNYSPEHIAATVALLEKKRLLSAIVVDASHGNSGKVHLKQLEVVRSVASQVALGQRALNGVMIESHLLAGRQPHDINNRRPLEYGRSITDACVDLDDTAEMFDILAASVQDRRQVA